MGVVSTQHPAASASAFSLKASTPQVMLPPGPWSSRGHMKDLQWGQNRGREWVHGCLGDLQKCPAMQQQQQQQVQKTSFLPVTQHSGQGTSFCTPLHMKWSASSAERIPRAP